MLDKLRLWNYVTLHNSVITYRASGNEELTEKYMGVLDDIWYNKLSSEDIEWLSKNAFEEPYGWDNPARPEIVLQRVKDIGKLEQVVDPLTEQLPLF